MGHRRHTTTVLTILVLPGIAASATAGELGRISNDSISIAINIPPHFVLKPAHTSADRNGFAGRALCIESNGAEHYRVAIADSQSLRAEHSSIFPKSTLQLLRVDGANCVSGGVLSEIESAHELSGAHGSPVTLFIIPD
jgi:hypothetical protein